MNEITKHNEITPFQRDDAADSQDQARDRTASAVIASFSTLSSPLPQKSEISRFKEARSLVTQNLDLLIKTIHTYRLSPHHLGEIAKLAAEKNGKITAINIHKFGIENPNTLVEIAKICARKYGVTTSGNILNFGIQDQKTLIEIAMLCVLQNGLSFGNLANFEIKDQKALFKIAMLSAQKNCEATLRYIGDSGIAHPKARIAIAKFCAQKNPRTTAECIQNFGIKDQKALIKIAKLCVYHHAWAGEHIQNFGIKDQKTLVKMAKMCARREGWIAVHIRKFGIEDPQALIDIAKLCAFQNGEAAATYIQEFGIQDQKALLEIAEICLQEKSEEVAQNIENFQFSEESKQVILVLAVTKNPRNLKYLSQSYSHPSIEIGRDLEAKPEEELLKDLEAAIDQRMPGTDSGFIVGKIRDIENPDDKIQGIVNAAASIFLWESALKEDEFQWLIQNRFFEHIFALEAPHLRHVLIHSTFSIQGIENAFDSCTNICSGLSNPLLKLPLARLLAEGVDISPLKTLREAQVKDSKALITLIEAFELLSRTRELTPEEKSKVVAALQQNPVARSRDLLIILQCQQYELLRTEEPIDLPRLAQIAFQNILPLPMQIDDFTDCFERNFGSYRQPEALMAYAANLMKLNDPLAMESLGGHVASILNGTYRSERYSPQINPHLAVIGEHFGDCLMAWQQNSPLIPLSEILETGGREPKVQSMHDWLREKILVDKHMEGLSFLERHLKGDTAARIELIEQKRRDAKNSLLNLQEKCIQLANSLRSEHSLRLLKEILQIQALPELFQSEFANDIRGKVSALSENQSMQGLFAIETDDPEDLLMAGTEIQGSCQRIVGDPELNKGLLGYLRNGQTRLIAIKNSSGRLVARSLIRLLWDRDQPVLFLERLYSNSEDPRIANAIFEMAKRCANRLECPLTAISPGEPYGTPLESLGGVSPYEYVDGVGGIREESQFLIEEPNLIYSPTIRSDP